MTTDLETIGWEEAEVPPAPLAPGTIAGLNEDLQERMDHEKTELEKVLALTTITPVTA